MSKPWYAEQKQSHFHSRLGKLEVTATTEQTIVKFKGYILAVGAGEQVEVTIESDGQFRLVMPAPSNGEPFNLFKEAPCRYSIQQIDSAASFFAIDPKVNSLHFIDSLSERVQKLCSIYDIT